MQAWLKPFDLVSAVSNVSTWDSFQCIATKRATLESGIRWYLRYLMIIDDQPMGFCSFEAMRLNRALLEGQVCCPKGLKWTLQAGGGWEFMGISQGNWCVFCGDVLRHTTKMIFGCVWKWEISPSNGMAILAGDMNEDGDHQWMERGIRLTNPMGQPGLFLFSGSWSSWSSWWVANHQILSQAWCLNPSTDLFKFVLCLPYTLHSEQWTHAMRGFSSHAKMLNMSEGWCWPDILFEYIINIIRI